MSPVKRTQISCQKGGGEFPLLILLLILVAASLLLLVPSALMTGKIHEGNEECALSGPPSPASSSSSGDSDASFHASTLLTSKQVNARRENPLHVPKEKIPREGDTNGFVRPELKIDRLPLPPLPFPQKNLIKAADISQCWTNPESLSLFGFCCGVRYSSLAATHHYCWGNAPHNLEAQLIHPGCCHFGAVCSIQDVYGHEPRSATRWQSFGAIPPLTTRNEIGCVLQAEGKTRGVELGVYKGEFARNLLYNWPAAAEYVLVDLWESQENYEDMVNLPLASAGEEILLMALEGVELWKDKIRICRNYTTVCATLFPDEWFDFVYIDARHDRYSVRNDIETWWPKLRTGGILAGHDYITQWDVWSKLHIHNNNDTQFWAKSPDGSIEDDGLIVKGAVDEFALKVRRQIYSTQQDPFYGTFWSWLIRK